MSFTNIWSCISTTSRGVPCEHGAVRPDLRAKTQVGKPRLAPHEMMYVRIIIHSKWKAPRGSDCRDSLLVKGPSSNMESATPPKMALWMRPLLMPRGGAGAEGGGGEGRAGGAGGGDEGMVQNPMELKLCP